MPPKKARQSISKPSTQRAAKQKAKEPDIPDPNEGIRLAWELQAFINSKNAHRITKTRIELIEGITKRYPCPETIQVDPSGPINVDFERQHRDGVCYPRSWITNDGLLQAQHRLDTYRGILNHTKETAPKRKPSHESESRETSLSTRAARTTATSTTTPDESLSERISSSNTEATAGITASASTSKANLATTLGYREDPVFITSSLDSSETSYDSPSPSNSYIPTTGPYDHKEGTEESPSYGRSRPKVQPSESGSRASHDSTPLSKPPDTESFSSPDYISLVKEAMKTIAPNLKKKTTFTIPDEADITTSNKQPHPLANMDTTQEHQNPSRAEASSSIKPLNPKSSTIQSTVIPRSAITQTQSQPNRPGEHRSTGKENLAPYSTNTYRIDALFLKNVIDKFGNHPEFENILTADVRGAAKGLSYMMTDNQWRRIHQLARNNVDEQLGNGVQSLVQATKEIVERFSNGPEANENSEDIDIEPQQSHTQEQRKARHHTPGSSSSISQQGPGNRRHESPETATEEVPYQPDSIQARRYTGQVNTHDNTDSLPNRPMYRPPPRFTSMEPYGHGPPYQLMGYPPPGTPNAAMGYGTYYQSPAYPPWSPYTAPYNPHQAQPPNAYREERPQAQFLQPRSPPARYLKPENVGSFDGHGSVETFISRIYSLGNRFGMDAVLEVLPLCLKDEAQSWYDTLDYDLKEQMNYNENLWCFQLRRRFQKDPVLAEEEMERCQFSYGKEDQLNLRSYLIKKQSLLREAGYEQPDKIIQKIWRGLDPILMGAVECNPYIPIDAFIQKLYNAEFAGKQQYVQTRNMMRRSQDGQEWRSRTRSPNEYARRPDISRTSNRVVRFADQADQQGKAPTNTFPNANPPSPRMYPLRSNSSPKLIKAPPDATERNALGPRKRYPCTHCGSNDHIDPQCPTRQAKYQNRTNHVLEGEYYETDDPESPSDADDPDDEHSVNES